MKGPASVQPTIAGRAVDLRDLDPQAGRCRALRGRRPTRKRATLSAPAIGRRAAVTLPRRR